MDSLRRVVGQVFSRPEFQWVERHRVLSWLLQQWDKFRDWLNRLAEQHPTGYNIGLGLLVIVLVVLVVHIGYVVWRIVRPGARTGARATTARPGIIVNAAWHVARAEELARAGHYAEALAHRFLAAVLELDRIGALRFHASKTPAEYVGEARLDELGRASLARLVTQLYRHLFGAVPCDEREYQSFGIAAQELATRQHVLPA
ncbi:MAG: hypothetical protein AUI08_04275 [Gemmatimonadetes bacterium 13_2_20CM_2_65_7]|nr:MAG: hypothetical protein AUI08_04275 [Gemmatimonadetes bacterium 13_2_20CM_2_65_7]OLD03940.1 MAG: hypothetical protein AUI89_00570 [Gemmatimonadetes bacterium 13_1_40CM_3_65_8]